MQPPAAVQSGGRRLAVGDQDDLPVGGSLGSEKLARKAQGLLDVGSVLHEVGDSHDRREILRAYDLSIGAEGDQIQRVLRELGLDQPMEGQGYFLSGMQGIVHEHGIAHIDQENRFAVGGKLLAVN